MARKFGIAISALLALSLPCAAQNSGNPQNPAAGAPGGTLMRTGTGAGTVKTPDGEAARQTQFDQFKRMLEQMSPEQRQKFAENLKRWEVLPPDERKYLKQQEGFMQGKMAQAVDEAIKNSGLQLDQDRKEVYGLRYIQERRKLEEKLRKEIDGKRKVMLAEMTERLKVEFSAPAPGAPVSSAPKSPATKPAGGWPKATATPAMETPPDQMPAATTTPRPEVAPKPVVPKG